MLSGGGWGVLTSLMSQLVKHSLSNFAYFENLFLFPKCSFLYILLAISWNWVFLSYLETLHCFIIVITGPKVLTRSSKVSPYRTRKNYPVKITSQNTIVHNLSFWNTPIFLIHPVCSKFWIKKSVGQLKYCILLTSRSEPT